MQRNKKRPYIRLSAHTHKHLYRFTFIETCLRYDNNHVAAYAMHIFVDKMVYRHSRKCSYAGTDTNQTPDKHKHMHVHISAHTTNK